MRGVRIPTDCRSKTTLVLRPFLPLQTTNIRGHAILTRQAPTLRLGGSLPRAKPSLYRTASLNNGTRQLQVERFDESKAIEEESEAQTVNAVHRFGRQFQRSLKGHDYQVLQDRVRKLLEDHGQKPGYKMYEALIQANLHEELGSAEDVTVLLQDMQKEGFSPDTHLWHEVLKALAVHPDYLLRAHVLNELSQNWQEISVEGWHDLVVGLIKDRQIESAVDHRQKAVSLGVEIDPWLDAILLHALCEIEEFDEIIRLLHQCTRPESFISPTLWLQILDSASRALHHELTIYVFRRRVQPSYTNPSTGICNNILHTAARHADIELATKVIQILSRRSGTGVQAHHYESLIDTYTAARDVKGALAIFNIMIAAGHETFSGPTRLIARLVHDDPVEAERAAQVIKSRASEDRHYPAVLADIVTEAMETHRNMSEVGEFKQH